MTIATEDVVFGPFTGNDVTTIFSFEDIKVFNQDDLKITKIDTLLAETILTRGVDYTVSLNADQDKNPGGTITYPLTGSPLASGSPAEVLVGIHEPDFLQGINLRTTRGYDPAQLEDGLDLLTILTQRANDATNRSIKIPIADSISLNPALPIASARANKILAFDATGSVTASVLADVSLLTLAELDPTDTNAVKNRILSNAQAKLWEDYKNVGHLPRAGGEMSGNITFAGAQTVDGRDVSADGATLDAIPRTNGLINGDFRISQRGTSFTAATSPANSDDNYLLDRWILLSDGNDIVDVSQETSVIPSGSYTACKSLVATGNKKFGFLQILEGKDAARFVGKNVSLSFKARTTTGAVIENIRAHVLSWDSTEDSVTSDVVSAWGTEGVNPTFAANWNAENIAADLAVSLDSYTEHKIENIAVDTSGAKNIAIFIHCDDTDAALNDVLYISDVNLVVSETASNFQARPLAEELSLCRRYFLARSSLNGAHISVMHLQTSTLAFGGFDFPVEMRSIPVASYPSSYAATWSHGGGTITLSTTVASKQNIRIQGVPSSALTAGHSLVAYMGASDSLTLNAEL